MAKFKVKLAPRMVKLWLHNDKTIVWLNNGEIVFCLPKDQEGRADTFKGYGVVSLKEEEVSYDLNNPKEFDFSAIIEIENTEKGERWAV